MASEHSTSSTPLSLRPSVLTPAEVGQNESEFNVVGLDGVSHTTILSHARLLPASADSQGASNWVKKLE